MSNSCVTHPRLSNGEKSPLFTRLKNFLGDRNSAEEVYYKAINPEFKKVFPKVRFDNNGEPFFDDLISQCGIGRNKTKEDTLKSLNEQYKTTPVNRSIQTVTELQNRASSFNINSSLNKEYSAIVTPVGDKIQMEIIYNTGGNNELGKRQKFNSELNSQLIKLLNSWGADVAALTRLEENSNIDGVLDLDAGINTATGLKEVIRIAKGEEGQIALPEEWGHFIVEAVKDNPLKDRMLSTLKNDNVLQRILGDKYERYKEVYNGNIELMAKEALGKMIAQVLNNYNPSAPNDRLFERYKNSVLDFFGRRDTDEIDEIINTVRNQVYEFTTNAFNNKYELSIDSKEHHDRLFSLKEKVSRDHKILNRIINQEKKRLSIYGQGAKATAKEKEENKGKFDEKQKQLIEALTDKLNKHEELDGIYTYLTESVNVLSQLGTRLSEVSNGGGSWKYKFATLRNIRDYMSSYGSIMEELKKEMFQAKEEGDDRFENKLREALNNFTVLISNLGDSWLLISKEEFAEFLAPFEGENLAMTIKGERKRFTISELLDKLDRDISIVERWTDAMADSTDPILRIYDSLVKNERDKGRNATIKDEKAILMQAKKLEEAGVKNTDFMYERTKDGKLTGNFVTRYNWGEYIKAYETYSASLDRNENLSDEDKEIFKSKWRRANTDKKGNPIEKYYNPQYDAIQRNKAMKEYYDFIMNLKKTLDYRLPAKYVKFNKAPQIRRDFLERALGEGNKVKYLWENLKDALVRREDDTEFSYTKQDFEGNQIYNLPIYYTKTLSNMEDLSMDCTSTMIAYASMAEDYAAMNNVIDALEVGRIILKSREVNRTKADKVLKDASDVLTKKGELSNSMQRLNDFMLMQVYGEQVKDEGTFFMGIDIGKAVNVLNRLQSYSTTALSVLTGTANLIQNITISNIESISKQFFSTKDLSKADWEYTKMLPNYLGELGNRIKVSKMALFDEKFNVTQNYKQHVKGIDWRRKTWASRFLKEDSIWFTTSAGDHYTQMRTALALAVRYKLKNKDGNPINLLDALQVKYLDEAHPEYGATLELIEGVTDQDGKPITSEYFRGFTKKVRGINNKLYGIYNQEDKNAAQYRAIGRLLMMYRNWMRPMWLKRYGVERYNYDTDSFEEGYYKTLYHYLKTTINDIKKGQFELFKEWYKLDSRQKGAVLRAVAELGLFITLGAIVRSLKGAPDDDKDSWFNEYVAYSIIRLKADMGSLIPGLPMLNEGVRIFDSPFAAVGTLKKIEQLFYLFDPDVWTTEIEQGVYKGYTKGQKILLEPVPFVRQFYNLFDPSEPAKWYK